MQTTSMNVSVVFYHWNKLVLHTLFTTKLNSSNEKFKIYEMKRILTRVLEPHLRFWQLMFLMSDHNVLIIVILSRSMKTREVHFDDLEN